MGPATSRQDLHSQGTGGSPGPGRTVLLSPARNRGEVTVRTVTCTFWSGRVWRGVVGALLTNAWLRVRVELRGPREASCVLAGTGVTQHGCAAWKGTWAGAWRPAGPRSPQCPPEQLSAAWAGMAFSHGTWCSRPRPAVWASSVAFTRVPWAGPASTSHFTWAPCGSGTWP